MAAPFFVPSEEDGNVVDGYVTLAEARRKLGISGDTLRRRLRQGEITLYSNPTDRRSRLVRIDELERHATPRLIVPPRREAEEMPSDLTA